MYEEIENVVFDLGGVVIDLEREKCIQAFRKLGYGNIEQDLGLYVQSGIFYDLECGHITAGEFYDAARGFCSEAGSDVEIQQAFNEFLRGLPVERLEALAALKERKRTFALSNTNAVMYHSWIDRAFRQQGLAINDYFHGIIASFQEGCCKPDPEIFRILLRRYGLEAARTLFLDDSEANCEAARTLGIRAEQVTPQRTILLIINDLLHR